MGKMGNNTTELGNKSPKDASKKEGLGFKKNRHIESGNRTTLTIIFYNLSRLMV